MNRDEIMNMQPGRELDSLISEKLMGFVTHGHFREKNGVRILVQPYSTSISAAWEVFEKVDHECDHSNLRHGTMGAWSCTFDNVWVDQAHTAPEAICKAALLSLIQEDTP